MSLLDKFRSMSHHAGKADDEILKALLISNGKPPPALGEFLHIMGAREVWLSRLEGRNSRSAIWPEISLAEIQQFIDPLTKKYVDYMNGLSAEMLAEKINYTNSSGQRFTDTVEDILLQILLHSQYHRGKINLLLRQHGFEPAPADYIAFVRGVPAATRHGSGKRTS